MVKTQSRQTELSWNTRMARSLASLTPIIWLQETVFSSQNVLVGRTSLHLNLRGAGAYCYPNVNLASMAGDFNEPRKNI